VVRFCKSSAAAAAELIQSAAEEDTEMNDPNSVHGAPPSVLRLCFVAAIGIYVSVKVIVWWLAVAAEGTIPASTTAWQWFWVVGDHVILVVFPFVFIPMLLQWTRGASPQPGAAPHRDGM
jgi:threonine/homoserine/homoserine lactone efflux protein